MHISDMQKAGKNRWKWIRADLKIVCVSSQSAGLAQCQKQGGLWHNALISQHALEWRQVLKPGRADQSLISKMSIYSNVEPRLLQKMLVTCVFACLCQHASSRAFRSRYICY